MELSQLFYFVAALSGIYLGRSCFQIVNNGESFQERRRELVVLVGIMVCSAGLGAYFKSTEQKRQGDIMPLKFQEEGQYYEGSTALGPMRLIIHNDTLQYRQPKYIKTN